MASDKIALMLRDKRWIDARKAFPLLALAFTLFFLALLFAITAMFPSISWGSIPSRMIAQIGSDGWVKTLLRHFDAVVFLGIATLQILYSIRASALERLQLSPQGIRYISPLPPVLKRLRPDWILAWDQIEKIELGPVIRRVNNPEFIMITLTAGSEKRQLFPVRWVDPDKYAPSAFKFRFAISSMKRDEMMQSVMDTPVMRFISDNAPHIAIDSAPGGAEVYTSLEKNPHGRMAMGMVFLLIVYAIVDFVAGPDAYIDAPASLLHIYLFTGIVVAVLSGAWLYRSALTAQEKIGLAVLIGMLAGVAMIPGALRINALSGSEAASTYDYFVMQGADSVVLKPVVEGMPNIDHFAKNGFWRKFGKDDTYPVQIRKGLLGFYQFRLSPILEDIRRYEGK